MNKLFAYDQQYLKKYSRLCGIDEVGRGCLAGPLVVCGIVMKYDQEIPGVRDSKKLTPAQRLTLDQAITKQCQGYVLIIVDVATIDQKNIFQATKAAMQSIAQSMSADTLILSDALNLDRANNLSLIKGDDTSYAIACASIKAKVYRDQLMGALAELYPQYDFKNNKGYGTKKHRAALFKYGYVKGLHRESFAPVKTMLSEQLSFVLDD